MPRPGPRTIYRYSDVPVVLTPSLIAAAFLLFLAGTLGSAIERFVEGFNQASSF